MKFFKTKLIKRLGNKGNNKKGFTLAELLIVVGIIAVLMAIAIPVFSGELASAKLATDHSNIRSTYTLMSSAKLTGAISVDGSSEIPGTGSHTWYLQTNGQLSATNGDGTYKLQADGSDVECSNGSDKHDHATHKKDAFIKVTAVVENKKETVWTLTLGT